MGTNKFKLAVLLAAIGIIAASPAFAQSIIFNDPNGTYSRDDDLVFSLDDYILNADQIEIGGRFRSIINDQSAVDNKERAGSVKINSKNLYSNGFYSFIENSYANTAIQHTVNIDIANRAEFKGSGINLNQNKQTSDPTFLESYFDIQARSIAVSGSGYANGISATLSAEGSGPVSGNLLRLQASADEMNISSEFGQAVYADGNSLQSSDSEGLQINLQAAKMTLLGGGSYGGTFVNNIALYAAQGAAVTLSGKGDSSFLAVTAKHENPMAYGDMSLYSADSAIIVDYGKNSTLSFDGGLFAYGNAYENAKIFINADEASELELLGNVIGVWGDISLNATGAAKIESDMIMVQNGLVSININAEESSQESFLKGNLISAYGDAAYGPSRISLSLSGEQNAFVGTSMIQGDPEYNAVDITLSKGSRWDVVPIEDANNFATNLILSGGTVNLPYGQAEGTFKELEAGTLSGTGGTINFNLALDANTEANDKLRVQRTEQGSHTVHVEVHQGFEPTNMKGCLIHSEDDSGAVFTADDNLLEAGAYLYSYQVASRSAPDQSQKEWFVIFDPYVAPEPEPEPEPKPNQPVLSPSGEAVAAMAGMGAQNALYLNQLSDLRKRLGEVRSAVRDGLWASAATQKDRIGGFSGTALKQTAYRFSFGFDRSVGPWLMGAHLKAMTADQETDNTRFHAEGDAHSEGISLYASYAANGGAYADFVVSVDRFRQSIAARMLNNVPAEGAYHNWGFGLSAEVGKKFAAANAWFIEPQAQLSFYRLEGDQFKLSNGMEVEQKDFNGLTARLGAAAGRSFSDSNGEYRGQIYSRFGIRHELLGHQNIHVNGIRFEDDLLGTRVYYGLGMDWLLTNQLKVFGHLERENGTNYTKELDFAVGIKYSF